MQADRAGEPGASDPRHVVRAEPQPEPAAAGLPAAGRTLLDLFDLAVRHHADRVAVETDDGTLTYRELDRAATAVASGLRRRGITDEDAVAVHLPRSADVFVAILGVLKARGSYVPVDPAYPAERRDLMIKRSRARAVITAPAGGEEPASSTVARVTLEELSDGVPCSDVISAPTDHHAACTLFTSGSSGTPKAVVLEHRNLVYFAVNPALPPLRPDDRVAHVSSVSFDAFTFEMWCTLAAGATIVVLPSLPQMLQTDVGRQFRRRAITAMLAPTMAVNHLASEDPDAFAGLRLLHTGGDVVLPAACERLLSSSFRGSLHNLYGPTEAATAVTGYRVDVVDPAGVPIGTPLGGATVYLLGTDGQLVGDNVVGEIFIGGAGVARGYLDEPALTADRFRLDPFAADGTRMYGTGDLARRRGGQLEFLGRKDDQVKIRGYRVEPREVEAAISQLTAVTQCAVVVQGEGDGKHLVAVVTGDEDLARWDLRALAAERLPDHLVPSAFVQVPQLPCTAHGKRDLARVRELARHAARGRDQGVPCSDLEEYLSDVWAELLGVAEVGVDDDFFALGGNSLLAFRLRRRLHADLKVGVDVQDVMGTTVLKDLARLLKGRQPASEVTR